MWGGGSLSSFMFSRNGAETVCLTLTGQKHKKKQEQPSTNGEKE